MIGGAGQRCEDPRVIGEFREYPGLIDALRIRARELAAVSTSLDDQGGLTEGHFSKLIGPRPVRRIGMKYLRLGSLELLHLPISLLNNAQRLPHFPVPNEETIITVTRTAYWDIELKILITGIRLLHPYVIIHAGCPEIRPGESIIQRPVGADRTGADRPLHKDPVPVEQVFKLF